jgi:hypothetical protein
MIKNKTVGGDTVNTKDWSYRAYLIRECEKLQAGVSNQPGHSIVPPRFASEMKIRARSLVPPMIIPIRDDSDLETALRAMHSVKYCQRKKDISAQLSIPFEHVISIEPTPPTGTPNASHPARRTATIRQREAAVANAAIAEMVGDFRTQIARRHACTDALCKHHPRPCIVTAQYGYLPLSTRIVRD